MASDIVADLHNHSTASDGDLAPAELVRRAARSGLRALALTDHDCLDGLSEALSEGEKLGIRVIPGTEVSVRFRRAAFTGSLHFLLYFSPKQLEQDDFRRALEDLLEGGRGPELVRARVSAINREFGPRGRNPLLSRPLEVEEITFYSNNATRRHFALALSEKHGLKDKETVNRIIANDSPAYLPSGVELERLAAFRAAHPCLCVLAHPAAGSWPGQGHYKEVLPPLEVVRSMLPEFLQTPGLDGIEVRYPGHTPEHQRELLQWAAAHRLLVTGGSDCHDDSGRPFGVEGMGSVQLLEFLRRLDALSAPGED